MAPREASVNPILPGCYPDPSVCRVGDTYYLVNSTFEYFPGLPVHASSDLVTWRHVGHALHRPGQLDLDGVCSSRGLYAPTLRHIGGRFVLVCTLVGARQGAPEGNFVLTADDPAGPWSDPVWIEGADGIDPSLFADDDGRVWYTGTRLAPEPQWPSQTEVWLSEIDPATWQLVGERRVIWRGGVLGGVWAEGPHVYRTEHGYLLLAAEGGTDRMHAVVVARAEDVVGPYQPCPANPVLTHRHLGRDYPIAAVGHADLVEAPDGSWWAVLLAVRPYGGYHYNLGRETFLVPVQWQDGWPVFAPGRGLVELDVAGPGPVRSGSVGSGTDDDAGYDRVFEDDFRDLDLDARWTLLRGPGDFWRTGAGGLELDLLPHTLAEPGTPAFLGVRQQHRDVDVSVEVDFSPSSPEEWVGLAVRQSEDHHALLVVVGSTDGSRRVQVVRRVSDRPPGISGAGEGVTVTVRQDVLASAPVDAGPVRLELTVRGQEYAMGWSQSGGPVQPLVALDGRMLDSISAGGFLGVWLGPYATANGRESTAVVRFSRFRYAPVLPRVSAAAGGSTTAR